MNQYPLFFMGMAFLVMAPSPDFMNVVGQSLHGSFRSSAQPNEGGLVQAQPWLPYLASSGATYGKPYFASERGLSETWACPPKPWRRWAKYARRLVRPSF